MNWAASHLTTRRVLWGVAQNGRFYRKKSGARKLQAKEKKGLLLGQGIFFWREENQGLIMQTTSWGSGGG